MSPLHASRPSLVRALGPLTATAMVVGTVIGSGIFKKPQEVASYIPAFGLAALAWILGGGLSLLGSLAYAEVAVLYPRSGGNYVFLREGFSRLAGFLYAWVEFWIIRSATLAALATVFTESLRDLLQNAALRQATGLSVGDAMSDFWVQRALTVAVIALLAGVNILGVRWGGGLQLFLTVLKVASLAGIAALPFVAVWLAGSPAEKPGGWENLRPLWPEGRWDLSRFGAALVGVLWAYHGWMNVTPVAEEVRHPQRNLPLALLGGTAIVVALYLAVNLAYAWVLPQAEMASLKGTTVAAVFCHRLLGPLGGAAASAAVLCSVFGGLNGNLLGGSRLVYAVGEDGLAPRALGMVHPRFRTPAAAIATLAGWAGVLVLGAAALTRYPLPVFSLGRLALDLNVPRGKSLFDVLTTFAMFGAVLFETLAVATIFAFRRQQPHAERAYRCVGYPAVPVLYVVLMAIVLVNMFIMQRAEAVIGLGFIALGAAAYGLVRRGSGRGTGGASDPAVVAERDRHLASSTERNTGP